MDVATCEVKARKITDNRTCDHKLIQEAKSKASMNGLHWEKIANLISLYTNLMDNRGSLSLERIELCDNLLDEIEVLLKNFVEMGTVGSLKGKVSEVLR